MAAKNDPYLQIHQSHSSRERKGHMASPLERSFARMLLVSHPYVNSEFSAILSLLHYAPMEANDTTTTGVKYTVDNLHVILKYTFWQPKKIENRKQITR